MSLSIDFSRFDFSRSINPAFLQPSPSIPTKIQNFISTFAPLLNAHASTRSILSTVLLAAHVKDLTQECMDLFFSKKDWDELKPQMQKTAIAVARLSLSIWFPFLYLIGSEILELATRLQGIDTATSSVRSIGEILIQCLYFISLIAEAPSWKATLHFISSAKGKSEDDAEKRILQQAPFFLKTDKILQALRVLPLLSKNLQLKNLQQYHPFISTLLILGSVIEASFKCFHFSKAAPSLSMASKSDIIRQMSLLEGIARYLTDLVKIDLTNEALDLVQKSTFLIGIIFPIVETIFQIQAILESWGKKNYHIGATGHPVQMDDVVGCEEAKKSVLRIVDQLKNPQKYAAIGRVRPIKGILFFGPPGTGKTMLAKALATAADNACFLEQAGSSFTEIFIGQGAKNIRDLFSTAHSLAQRDPTRLVVIFIDEINGIGAKRSIGVDGGTREENKTTEAFFIEMDRLPSNVVIIGATNIEPKDFDEAFVRAGRFDEHVQFKLPSFQERRAILAKLIQSYTIDAAIRHTFWDKVAQESEEWCYADLTNLIEQAAREAGYQGLPQITQSIFEQILEKLRKNKKEGSWSSASIYT